MPIRRPTVSSLEAQAEKRRIRGLPETPAEAAPSPAAAPSSEPAPEDVAADASPATPTASTPQAPRAVVPRPAPSTSAAPHETEFLTVIASTPAPGVSTAFDVLSEEMGATKALQAILRRALDAYEAALVDGSHAEGPLRYRTAAAEVRTSRRFDPAALAVARARFDPFDVITKADLGRKIANAALAAYFEHEAAR